MTDPWTGEREIGNAEFPEDDPHMNRRMNQTVELVLQELENQHTGTLGSMLGGRNPLWKGDFKKNPLGPANGSDACAFTAQVVTNRINLSVSLGNQMVEKLHESTLGDIARFSEYLSDAHPVHAGLTDVLQGTIRHIFPDSSRLVIHVTYVLSDTEKTLVFNPKDETELAEFLDILLGTSIMEKVDEMSGNPSLCLSAS